MSDLVPTSFDALEGWNEEDHEAAFAAFRHSASFILNRPPTTREGSAKSEQLLALAQLALDLGERPGADKARDFFEAAFIPHKMGSKGLLTGYYEPCFKGSRRKSPEFSIPLHKRPTDLHPIGAEMAKDAGLSSETSFARQSPQGWSYHVSRAEVYDGALDGQGLELVWLRDPVDAYIIHIQGSARIQLEDGSYLRVGFDGKSGYPYLSIGKVLIENGIFTSDTITMDRLTDWLREQADLGLSVMAQNPSYIFFKEIKDHFASDLNIGPKAAAGVPLLAQRSLAVDRTLHTFGMPIWLNTKLPISQGDCYLNKLVLAHDTGSAIKGQARGDLFCGTGQEAGRLAGELKQATQFTLLFPNLAFLASGKGV